MKKLYVPLLASMLASSASFAQFTTNNGNTTTNDKVGIGTQTPSAPLEVNISNQEPKSVSFLSNTGTNVINSPIGGLRFKWYGNNLSEIQMVRGYGATDGTGLSFHTSTANDGLTLERMRITNYGNIGIGTTRPTEKLNIDPQGAGGILIGNPNTGSDNYTSLRIQITGQQNGSAFLQSTKSAGAAYGTLAFNPWGGKTGIGTDNPISLLQVDDGPTKASIGDASGEPMHYGTSYLGFNAARDANHNWILHSDNNNNGGGMMYSDIFGNMYFAPLKTSTENSSSTSNQVLTDSDIRNKIAFVIDLNGITRAKDIRVATSVFPDYVFKSTYRLRPLSEVESYIDKNKHLPEMPTEKEVVKEGINLSEMNILLVKKVEELTLYLIKQEKDIIKLKSILKIKKKSISKLKSSR